MNLNKEVFTTFNIARITHFHITSIKNWIQKGHMKAYKTPGGHFRVVLQDLIDFLNEYDMPNPFQMDSEILDA